MTEPKNDEKYTPEGRTIVDDSVFDDPGEGEDINTPEDTNPPEDKGGGEINADVDNPDADNDPEDGKDDDVDDPDKKDNDPDEGKDDVLIAGKFKTKEELEKAYQNLGGDPAKFKTVEGLVEAYTYRESEFTRLKQEQAERDRIANLIPENTGKDKIVPNSQATVDEMMKKVDWTKVTDAQSLGQQLFTIMLENMPKAQQELTPEQLVEKVMPMMKEREEKQQALHEIETEVPRLKSDAAFRKAFAYHVVGGKSDGTKYPRTKEGLKDAMKDFLAWGKSIADESARQTKINNDSKNAAAGIPTGGSADIVNNKKGDEVDDIISAYAEKQKKLGF